MKRSELIFPNDNDIAPTDWNSQRMFDFEGLEERLLWCLCNEKQYNDIKESILNLVADADTGQEEFKFNIMTDMDKLKSKLDLNINLSQQKSPINFHSSL